MQPFTIILGIVTGTLVSIAFGLSVVLLIFWVLQGDHPRFETELPALVESAGMFVILAGIALGGLYGTLRRRPWRYAVIGVLCIGLIGTGRYFWPT